MKKLFLQISVIIIIAFLFFGCTTGYKTINIDNTELKVPSEVTEKIVNNNKYIYFPSGGFMFYNISENNYNLDVLTYSYYIVEELKSSGYNVTNTTSKIYNKNVVVIITIISIDTESKTFIFTQGDNFAIFTFSQKGGITEEFQVEIENCMNSIKVVTK